MKKIPLPVTELVVDSATGAVMRVPSGTTVGDLLKGVQSKLSKSSGAWDDGLGKVSGIVDDIKVPSVRNNEFSKLFDDLSVEEFQKLWDDPKTREIIKARIRKPGELHEWLVASRADTFKKWGVSMDDIKEFRTLIEDVTFINPPGIHGGLGLTTTHNEIIALIDNSSDFEKFVKSLNNWATDRLPNGILDLPEGLRR